MLRNPFLRWSAVAILCIVTASWCVSLALEGGWLRRSLEARLAAAFGRPVEVGRFEFTILGGPKLEADSVTVGEDPHFGPEYFLRAEQLTASLRWAALLRGRMEFDRLSLSRPSLNLERSPDGKWNAETWLPPANKLASLPSTHSSANVQERVSRIDIDEGRINFKKGADKLSFALVDVAGHLNLQGAGRWSLDLEAHPMRAAVVLQSAGTLRLRGTVGGASARLQPASLRLSWESASLADAARLARGTDYGLRGLLDAELSARIDPPSGNQSSPWKIEGAVRFQGVHRWNLAARQDNPAVNLKLAAAWRPGEPRLEVAHWVVEAPRSELDGQASIDWSHGFEPELDLLQSQIGFSDLLDWGHAFFYGVAEDLDIAGSAGLEAKFSGWPLRIEDVNIEGSGAAIRSDNGNLAPILIGPLQAVWSRSSLVLAPVAVRLLSAELNRAPRGARSEARSSRPEVVPEGVFHIDGALGPIHPGDALRDWPYSLTIAGQTKRLQDLRTAFAAAGWQYGSNWKVEGPASLKLVAIGALRPGAALFHGLLDFHDVRLSSDAVNEPILISAASVEFSAGDRRVEIAGAQALGAEWKGSLEKNAANADWTFDLSADRLEREDLARDLGQSRQGLLYRMFPFAGSAGLAPEAQAAIARINAHGHLYLDELALAPLRLERLDATVDLQDGALTLRRAQADLYGGRVSGEFHAQLGTELQYSFRGQVDRTDLSALAALTSVKTGFGGIGSGELELSAHGLGWQALLASLEGEGFLHIQDATIDALNLPLDPADTSFRAALGNQFKNSTLSFRVEDGHVHVDPWLLSGRQPQLEVVGDIDFSRRLSLQVRSLPRADRLGLASESPSAEDVWMIGGTLDAPQIVRQEGVSTGNEAIARTGRR